MSAGSSGRGTTASTSLSISRREEISSGLSGVPAELRGRRRCSACPSRSLSKGRRNLSIRGDWSAERSTGLCRDYSSGRSMPTATLRRCHTPNSSTSEAPIQYVPSPCALSARAATMRPRWMRTAISTRQVHSNSSSIRNTGSL